MELVDLLDENRCPLGRTAERHAPKAPGELRSVIHVCIFDSRGRLLLQRRAAEKKIWPGCWDVSAAGGVSAGEDCRTSAEREVQEELGLTIDLTGVRPSVTVNFAGGFDDFYILNRDVALEDLTLQTEEVAEVRWATLEEAQGLIDQGLFVPYPKSFLQFLYDMRHTFGFVR